MFGKNKGNGFTLIELLVVIAIIAVLAAILFPVFTSAKDKAKQAKCQSNLRQISNAFLLYLQDNDDRWPTFYWSYQVGSSGGWYPFSSFDKKRDDGWCDQIDKYVKNRTGVYICPALKPVDPRGFFHPVKGFTKTPQVSTYMYNQWLGATIYDGPGNPLHPNVGRKQSTIVSSSRTVAVNDGSGYDFGRTFFPAADGSCLPKESEGSSPGTNGGHITPVHNNGGQFIWADGHVSWADVRKWKPSMWWPSFKP